MTELVEKLLQPVSAENPCGPDLSYDPRFDELQTLLKGTPEVEIGNLRKPAEPPDWGDLQRKSVEFLGQSKDLRVGVMLCCGWLRTGGLAGFRDGIQLVGGLLQQYWGPLHPLLDPEDNNDPTQRLNILNTLVAPRGTLNPAQGGWLVIIDHLFTAPLCQPKGTAPVSFDQLQAAKLRQVGSEGTPAEAPALASLEPVLRAGRDQVAASHKVLQEALEVVQAIDQFLTSTLSAGQAMSFDELLKTLTEMLSSLQPYLPTAGAEAGAVDEAGGAAAEAAATGGVSIAISGSIRSRDDVVTTLDKICRYYEQVEPSSPVPFLLKRAQKLATMNFVEAVQELNLIAGLDALKPSMGSAVESAPPPPAA
jgi:type VI secretion system protein ImpA